MKLSLICLLALALCTSDSSAQLLQPYRIDVRLEAKPYRDTSLIKKKRNKDHTLTVTDSIASKNTLPEIVTSKKKGNELNVSQTDTTKQKRKCFFKNRNRKTLPVDSSGYIPGINNPQNLIQDAGNVSSDTTQKKKKRKEKIINEQDTTSVQEYVTPLLQTPEEMAQDLKESGDLNMKGNNFDQAIFYYNKIITLYSATSVYPDALFARSRCYMEMNDKEAALNDISLYIKAKNCEGNSCADAFYMRANIYFNSGRYGVAIADFTEAAKDSTYKNYKFCFFYRALCEGELGQNIQSVLDFTKFLSLDNYKTVSSAEALYYRGFYKVKLSDNRGAISDYDKAIELYKAAVENSKSNKNIYLQKLIDTYITRALAKAEIKKYDEAIVDYNIVLKMNPNYATAYRLKGLAEINKGDLDNGCMDLSRAGELGSTEAYEDIKHLCK